MPTVAAPVITREMAEWISFGGGNSGIVGNVLHDYGFHIGARYLSRLDYSRRRDPNGSDGPYVNWDYACAGDFSHGNKESLRKHHRRVLNGLMNGQYPMICEFIGKPWADRPVYYWARWKGIKTLQRYTGQGHDHWSHVAWYRSKVDQKANLWTLQEDKEMAFTSSDSNKVWKADGSINAPTLAADGTDRSAADIKKNPTWSGNSWAGASYNNVARLRGETTEEFKKSVQRDQAILDAIRGVSSSDILKRIDLRAQEAIADRQKLIQSIGASLNSLGPVLVEELRSAAADLPQDAATAVSQMVEGAVERAMARTRFTIEE